MDKVFVSMSALHALFVMFNFIISAWRFLSCVVFSVRGSSALPFILFVYSFLFYRVCGSGARGLIKAPAGSGAGPGRLAYCTACQLIYCGIPLPEGGVRGGIQHRSLLDLPVLTDTARCLS